MSERQWSDILKSLITALPDKAQCKRCGHPMTAHTDTEASLPFSVCARSVAVGNGTEIMMRLCGCRLLAGVND